MLKQAVTSEHHTGAAPRTPADGRPVASHASERGEHSSGLTIIASKIAPASEGRPILTRPRLVGWLEQQREARVILVSAEAGYGKSTLLSDFALRSEATCIWYRIETSDGDWITFLSYMVAALRDVVPDFGRQTEALLRHVAAMGSSRELVLAQFLADLGDLGGTDLVVILDDYHLAGDTDDVRLVMSRLLERAPAGLRFVLAGRGRPNLALGRLTAQGRVSELTTRDLRFTGPEIEELFAVTYAQTLDEHARDVVVERTQGWAASLQLVSASIAVSRPSEVGAFIEALNGATGPIYDFLAEEVLTRMSSFAQRVLIHASLIDRVTPELVTAALSVMHEGTDLAAVAAHLEDAQTLGLLGDGGESAGVRIHPLFRQFLEHQLVTAVSQDQIRAIHKAIARVAEKTAWLAAAKHYALAGEPDTAMRVLGSAASEALGTGAWGGAVEVIALMPDTPPPPAVEVIRARALTSYGRPDDAILALAAIDPSALDADERALVSLARAGALQMGGYSGQLWQEVHRLGTLGHSDPVVDRLAHTWALMRTACQGGSISEARRSLDRLSEGSTRENLGHFAAIALHNAATAALAQGHYEDVVQLAMRARTTLLGSPVDASIGPSTLVTQALAHAELGNVDEGTMLADEAASAPDAHPDVLADATYLATVSGNSHRAETLGYRLRRLLSSGPVQVGALHQAAVVRVVRLISSGRFEDAAASAKALGNGSIDELDGVSRSAYLVALTSALLGSSAAPHDVAEALAAAEAQQAWRWEFRLRLLDAAVRGDGGALSRWIADCAELSSLANLELADLIGASLHLLDPVPPELVHSMVRYPARWRPVLLRQLEGGGHASAHVAAKLLADIGTQEDASLLAAYERHSVPPGRKARLSRALVRRVSPTLRIHDLGRTTYEVSGVEVRSSAARRKALALLLYLVTRPRQTATREQVMEELWPKQTPASATNSLHQTLHFVRRDIAPWQDGGATADYVPLDSELVYLDPELVQVDSISFMRQATEALSALDLARTGPKIARLYSGRFAPEFEYEDWAEDWRTLVHAQFLRLSQATAAALLQENLAQLAIDVLSRAIEIDGLAFDMRTKLIRTLVRAGAADAATDHYRHYANLLKREAGLRAPSLDTLIKGDP